jgi:hypothetical protein
MYPNRSPVDFPLNESSAFAVPRINPGGGGRGPRGPAALHYRQRDDGGGGGQLCFGVALRRHRGGCGQPAHLQAPPAGGGGHGDPLPGVQGPHRAALPGGAEVHPRIRPPKRR